MKDLNVRQEAIKILEEKVGKNLFDLGRSNFLLNMRRKRISFALLVGMQTGAATLNANNRSHHCGSINTLIKNLLAQEQTLRSME